MQLRADRELTDEEFLGLIEAKSDSFYRVAYGYVHNAEDAKDIVQDAVCKAYVGKASLKDREKFYPWFYRILAHTASSFLRRTRRSTGATRFGSGTHWPGWRKRAVWSLF